MTDVLDAELAATSERASIAMLTLQLNALRRELVVAESLDERDPQAELEQLRGRLSSRVDPRRDAYEEELAAVRAEVAGVVAAARATASMTSTVDETVEDVVDETASSLMAPIVDSGPMAPEPAPAPTLIDAEVFAHAFAKAFASAMATVLDERVAGSGPVDEVEAPASSWWSRIWGLDVPAVVVIAIVAMTMLAAWLA